MKTNYLDYNKEKIKGYIALDCTAESLHKLTSNHVLKTSSKTWSQANCIIGGGTTRIGDPSGKDKTRKILTEKEIDKNIKVLKKF